MDHPQEYFHEEPPSPRSQRRASRVGSKVTRERVALLVSSVLLAAAAIVMYRLFFDNFRAKGELQTLRDECEALRDSELKCLKKQTEKPTRWELHEGRCYYFSATHYSWKESRCLCQSAGGDLVIVESRDEQGFLYSRVRDQMKFPEDRFWIGLTDAAEEGTWVWVDSSPLNRRLAFWAGDEPDDWKQESRNGEDCARMGNLVPADDLTCWFDKACQMPQRYICEKAAEGGGNRCA